MTEAAELVHRDDLPSGWTRRRLREVTTKIGSGATPRGGASVYVAEGPALIRSQNVHDNRFEAAGLVHLDEVAARSLRGVTVEPQDVLINITGDSILRCCLVPDRVLPARVNQHVAILRAKNQILPLVLQKQLVLPEMKHLMLGHSAGGTRKAITKGHLENFLIVVPPLEEQRQLAKLLGAFDDKIESNRRQSSLTDALLRMEFTAITDGCPVGTPLADLASFTKGVSYRSAELSPSGDTCLVTLKSVGRQGGYRPSGLKPYAGLPKAAQVLLPGDLVVAQTDLTQAADVIGRTVRVPKDVNAGRLVASLDLVIARPLDGTPAEYLYGVLLEERFRQHCRSRSSGTTVLHLSRDALPQYEAPDILLAEQERFASLARPLLDKHDALGRESARVVALRDALLPELLSGRIRVPEASEAVESALG